MASSEVQRTLVKSPPELWAELGDPASLARHLGDFGEIRTIRIEPETTVEWEADAARGTVQLKPSGWGTRVTLTVIREHPEAQASTAQAPTEQEPIEPACTTQASTSQEPTVQEPTAQEPAEQAIPTAEPDYEPEPEPTTAARRWRPRFLTRLFRRQEPRAAELGAEQPEADARGEDEVAHPESAAACDPAPIETPEPAGAGEDVPDLASELAQVEAAMAAEDSALLTAVLDRLGAAHHRPFSRG
jgi:hypothetical protein